MNLPLLGYLRLVLAAIVLSDHLRAFGSSQPPSGYPAGAAAVLVFFVVSGYCIRHSISARPRGFYARRLLRIYPGYLLSLPITLALGVVCAWNAASWRAGLNVIQLSRISLLDLIPLHSVAREVPGWNPPLWSLGVEVFYYLVCPLFRALPDRILWFLLVFSAGLYVFYASPEPPRLFCSVLFFGWAWILGWLFYGSSSRVQRGITLVAPAGLFVVSGNFQGNLGAVIVASSVLCLVIQANLPVPVAARKWGIRGGEFSYPLYVAHVPALLLLLACGLQGWKLVSGALLICILLWFSEFEFCRAIGLRTVFQRI